MSNGMPTLVGGLLHLGAIAPFDWQIHVADLWRGAALSDTLLTIGMGVLVALPCAWFGCFLILQGRALLSDAISHTVLLGIVVAALITGSTGSGTMLLAAILTGGLTTALVGGIRCTSRIKDDAALGIVFTALFALGVLLLSTLASRAHLDPQHALYGNLEFIPLEEPATALGVTLPIPVWQMFGLCCVLLLVLVVFFKHLVVTSFDPLLAESLGMHPKWTRVFLMTALCLTVVGGFSSVGAILVVGLLIAPPATAFLLTTRLPTMLAWASVCGIVSSLIGYHIAYWLNVTVAGTIVCCSCGLFAVTLLFSPREGLIAHWARKLWQRIRIGHENLARLLLRLGATPTSQPVSLTDLALKGKRPIALTTSIVQQLRWRGWVELVGKAQYRLTPRGLVHAQRLDRAHRLWEAFLVDRVGLSLDLVHPNAEEIEHILDDHLIDQLDDALGHPGYDPHGKPIPRIPVSPDRPNVFALSRLRVGDMGRIVGLSAPVDGVFSTVANGDSASVQGLGLQLGEHMELIGRDQNTESWTLRLADGRDIVASHSLADQIIVELIEARVLRE